VNNALLLMFKRGVLESTEACHVHDLRRTFISRLPDLGFEPFVAHKSANHVLPGVLAHYNLNEYMTHRQDALHAWAAEVERRSRGTNVLRFDRTAA
jgi:hypothetical protein